MMRSPIVSTTLGWLSPLLLVLSGFLLLRGHHEPGGGFSGGLVLALVILLEAKVRGCEAARRLLRAPPAAWIATGLGLALISGCLGLVLGDPYLAARWVSIGDSIKLGTPLLFDVGVFALVAGVVSSLVLPLMEAD